MFQTQIHADDTGGVTWLGFPVLKLGFSDAARQFHLVLIALASDKTSKNYAFAAYTLRTKRPDLASVRFCMSDGAEAFIMESMRRFPLRFLANFRCLLHMPDEKLLLSTFSLQNLSA